MAETLNFGMCQLGMYFDRQNVASKYDGYWNGSQVKHDFASLQGASNPKMHWTIGSTAVLLNALLAVSQETSIFSHASNDSLLWGPYRPNLYFGLRPRLPKSVSTTLMWGRVEDYTTVQNLIRFTCEQGEDIAGYGWDAYDPRTGGIQTIHDKGNGIDLETSFVKFDEGRGGWGARIKGTIRVDAEPTIWSPDGVAEQLKTAVWFTVGVEGLGSVEVQGAEAAEDFGFDKNVVFNGQTNDLGDFKLTISEPRDNKNQHPFSGHPAYQSKPLDYTLVHSVQIPETALWQSKGAFAFLQKTSFTGNADVDSKLSHSAPFRFDENDD